MKEWALAHYWMTFIIVIFAIYVTENQVINLLKVIIAIYNDRLAVHEAQAAPNPIQGPPEPPAERGVRKGRA